MGNVLELLERRALAFIQGWLKTVRSHLGWSIGQGWEGEGGASSTRLLKEGPRPHLKVIGHVSGNSELFVEEEVGRDLAELIEWRESPTA